MRLPGSTGNMYGYEAGGFPLGVDTAMFRDLKGIH